MKLIRKNNKFGFKSPKRKKLYILQKLKWRIFFAMEKPIISFLSTHPRTSKPDKKNMKEHLDFAYPEEVPN